MIRRLSALFHRYLAAHLDVAGPGFGLTDGAGRRVGQVDLVRIKGNRVHVSGLIVPAAAGMRITLSADAGAKGQRGGAEPDMPEATLPFDVQIPLRVQDAAPALTLTVSPPDDAPDAKPVLYAVPLPPSGAARARLGLAFTASLLQIVPATLQWRLTRDPVHRATVKRVLGLDFDLPTGEVKATLLQPAEPAPQPDPQPITIILPVYNAFDLLAEVLARVVAHTDLPWHLIVIEDCSSDARVRPFLQDWAATQNGTQDRVTLILNPQNLGFIGSVNAALALAVARGEHVVLLNSDAFVPAGWASRLLGPILQDQGVASVTPMSNDAEIFSSPALCRQTVLDPGMADLIDAAAQGFRFASQTAEVPTGVGFCMAINHRWLALVPSLDPAFGRGYGEEVDWCQRVRILGGRHLGLAGLYVEHRGGTSFGSDDKRRLIAQNNATIAKRYPAYDGEVQDFIAADPLFTARLALAVAWAAAWAAQDPARSVPVYLAHTLGGGATKYLDRRIADDLAATGRPAIVLRTGGETRWQVEVMGPAGMIAGHIGTVGGTKRGLPQAADTATLLRLLEPLGRRQIIYSCGVGDPDPLALPGLLLQLAGAETGSDKAEDAEIEILFHDYFPLSPAYTLLDADGAYRGPLTPASLPARPAGSHQTRRPDGSAVTLADWQGKWGALIAAATRIVVFSHDSRGQVLAAYPDAGDRILVRPHPLLTAVPRLNPPAKGAPVIGVLGNIGAQKGAGVLCDLAALLGKRTDGTKLVLIGNLDPSYHLPPTAPVHGDYTVAELPALAARYGVTHWLIPSIWPETFSYTTHEALATGLPVMAFDLGAQGAAVAQAPNGMVLPFAAAGNLTQTLAQTVLNAVKSPVQELT